MLEREAEQYNLKGVKLYTAGVAGDSRAGKPDDE